MEILKSLLRGLRGLCCVSNQRRGEIRYSISDVGMAAFSTF